MKKNILRKGGLDLTSSGTMDETQRGSKPTFPGADFIFSSMAATAGER
jgi:hypothetical protein